MPLQPKKVMPSQSNDREKMNRHWIKQAQLGHNTAVTQLIAANQGLVIFIATKYPARHLLIEDRINEGFLGLMEAINKFDLSRTTRFSTYATYWIRAAIETGLMKTEKTIRIPADIIKRFRALSRLQSNLEQASLHHIGPAQLNQLTHGTEKDIYPLLYWAEQHHQHDAIENLSPFSSIDSPLEHQVMRQEEHHDIEQALNALPNLTQSVLCYRYGLQDHPTLPRTEIAKTLHIHPEKVRYLEARALEKLSRLFKQTLAKRH